MIDENRYLEQQKVTLNYIKHLTTLCTGSILLLALLLEKFFTSPHVSWLVTVVFGCFLTAVLFLSLSAFGVLLSIREPNQMQSSVQHYTAITFILGAVSFISALITLGTFSVINWIY
ncbi:hypothetical protein GLP31_19295 [Photobacterium carnosum]|uniref:hypothetical protein n=1 Tax=Photobacterium carnosum TaxID=2023717 RepID=UPI001E4A1AF5|nr:hypothetical protein [Photobacterium carnosum]MCD9554613.1 hypothetical protein [Photobacterium carnosum]